MESAATEPFAEWFTGEFLPFGDLVSDVWLWSTLPREKPEDYSCSAETYTVMRALLMVGTVVDAIPDVAILLGLLAGLVVAVVGKARAVITPTEQRRTPPISVRNVVKNVPGLARYVFSDGKSITNFLINRVGHKETTWDNTMELVAWHTLVFCHAPFLSVQRRCFRYQVNSQFNGYLTIILVQLIAGGLTEASSIFFAVMGGGTVSIVSAWFGLYSLVMTTMLAVYRGNLVRKFGPNATVTSPAAARNGCWRALEGVSDALCGLIPAAVFGLGAFMVIMGITFFSTVGASSTEAWMLVVPGSVVALLGWVSSQLLIRHYHSTSQDGMIIREQEPGV
ncbi:expressed unknown protein [Ectocarpus siliculosus]|uniref:Uncharacterized protein n=1 Tax=Ectocarpus siliculosus TaxID=2880 RepID=D7FX09_ECTSI|nr:expressed unknown protein [Ectocarpus siliculosus]|eukprot:CBJ26342.1 expressed unknown protein [Ectocarpus siliculosus]